MATYFSNHYNAAYTTQTVIDAQYKVPTGISHARLRYKACRATVMALTTDQIRFATFRSSDRLVKMVLSCQGDSTLGALNLGAYLSGVNHTGAVIDVDIFGAALATAGALTQTEALTVAGLENVDRARPLWEQASDVTATYTADPELDIDIVGVPSADFTVLVEAMLLEIWYTTDD